MANSSSQIEPLELPHTEPIPRASSTLGLIEVCTTLQPGDLSDVLDDLWKLVERVGGVANLQDLVTMLARATDWPAPATMGDETSPRPFP
jgi:hypothetical protein